MAEKIAHDAAHASVPGQAWRIVLTAVGLAVAADAEVTALFSASAGAVVVVAVAVTVAAETVCS